MIYHTVTYYCNPWQRSCVQWYGMADEPHEEGISLKCSTNMFCSICNALCPQYRFFQHSSFVSNCEACEMYISWWLFLYISATWEGYIGPDIHICTYFVCICFLQIVGEVIQHGRWCPFPHWEAFHWYSPKSFLQYVYFCISPKTFVKHHDFCRNCKPYNIYIPLWLFYKFSYIHADICLLFDMFTNFLSGNAWHRLWMQRYGMTDKTPYIWLKVTVTFQSGGYHPQNLTAYETDIYVRCLSTSTFLSVPYQIWMHNIIFMIHLALFHTNVISVM